MSDFTLVWALSSVGILAAIYVIRSIRFRRPARASEMHLRGTLAFCAVFGAIPAFLYDTQPPAPVDLPDALQNRPALTEPAGN